MAGCEAMYKVCTNCGILGQVDKDFSRTFGLRTKRQPKNKSDWHSRCKKCRSAIITRAYLEKKLALFPYLYIECDNCDHIYNKCHSSCKKCGNYNSLQST